MQNKLVTSVILEEYPIVGENKSCKNSTHLIICFGRNWVTELMESEEIPKDYLCITFHSSESLR